MHIGAVCFYFADHFAEELKVHFRMNTTYNMYFSYRLSIVFAYNVQHLLWVNSQPSSLCLYKREYEQKLQVNTQTLVGSIWKFRLK
jgi:hypothetical protein